MEQRATIPGYTYGSAAVPRSPVSLAEFELMKQSVLFTDDDVKALRQSYDIVKDQVEAILDVWYGFVGKHPHLLAAFTGRTDVASPSTSTSPPCGSGSASGSWIRREPNTINTGSTTNTKSGSGTTAPRKTRPTTSRRRTMCRSGTCWP